MLTLLFAWNCLAPCWLGARYLRRWLPATPPLLFLPSWVVLTCSLVLVLLQLCSAVGGNLTWVFATVLAALAGYEWTRRSPGKDAPPTSPGRPIGAFAKLASACILLTWCGLFAMRSGPTFSAEDLAYHAPFHAVWSQTGSLAVSGLGYQAYFPANADLLAFWFVGTHGTDALAGLATLVWVLLLVSSWLLFARQMELNLHFSVATLAFLLASPSMWKFHSSYSAVDLCVTATALYALAVAWLPAPIDRGALAGRAALCGLGLGIGIGAKPILAPLVLACGAWWLYQSRRHRCARAFAAFLLCLCLTGSYWYLRNWWTTGNPIFPAEFLFFEGPFDRDSRYKTSIASLLSHPGRYNTDLFSYLEAWAYTTMPMLLTGVLGLASWAVALVLRTRERREQRERFRYSAFVGLCLLSFWAFFLLSPFSATSNLPSLPLHFPFRYLCFPLVLGSLMLCLPGTADSRSWRLATVLPLSGLVWACLQQDWLLESPVLIAATTLGLWSFERLRARLPAGLPWAAAACCLALLSWQRGDSSAEIPDGLTSYGPASTERRELFAVIEQLPPSQIGLSATSPGNLFYTYPLFGRRLQHRTVPLSPDGSRREPTHKQDKPWWWDFHPPPESPASWVENLENADLDFVLFARSVHPDGPWPLPVEELHSRQRFALHYQDRVHQLWSIRSHR